MKKSILILFLSILSLSMKSQWNTNPSGFGCYGPYGVCTIADDGTNYYNIWGYEDTSLFVIEANKLKLTHLRYNKVNTAYRLLTVGADSSIQWVLVSDIPGIKHQETYSGTTDLTGIYTVTFPVAYSVAPHIIVTLKGSTDQQGYDGLTVTTTGFSVHVYERTYTMGVSNGTTDVSGIGVDALITEK